MILMMGMMVCVCYSRLSFNAAVGKRLTVSAMVYSGTVSGTTASVRVQEHRQSARASKVRVGSSKTHVSRVVLPSGAGSSNQNGFQAPPRESQKDSSCCRSTEVRREYPMVDLRAPLPMTNRCWIFRLIVANSWTAMVG